MKDSHDYDSDVEGNYPYIYDDDTYDDKDWVGNNYRLAPYKTDDWRDPDRWKDGEDFG